MGKNTLSAMFRNKLISSFSTYFLTSLINRALPFLLLPVLTRHLTPVEYGIFAIYQVIVSFFTPMVGMNMSNNITRNFFKKPKEEIAKIISNLLIVLSITFSIISIGFGAYILLSGSAASYSISGAWLYSVPVIAAMNTINQFNLTIFRNQNRALMFGSYEIGNTSLNVGITVILVVGYNMGWQGCAAGLLISSVAFGVFGLVQLYRSGFLKLNLDWLKIREILTVSFPLIFHALGIVIINLSDRFFINFMVGKEAVGLYTVGYQFGMIIVFITDSINKVWSPWLYNQLSQIDCAKKLNIVKYTYIYIVGILFGAIILTFSSYYLLVVMTTSAFYDARDFILWVTLGYAVRGMYTMVFPYLVYVGKTSFLGMMTIATAGINLLANYILIKLNGSVGAAQATFISFVILFWGVWWYANRIYPMPWFPFRAAAAAH